MEDVLFFLAAIGAVVGAIGVIAMRNPFYSVLALVSHLLSLALLFLLLQAQFVAAAQVVVYAGAVMVLYIFVVSYVGGREGEPVATFGPELTGVGIVLCVGLFVELSIAILGSGLKAIDSTGAKLGPAFGQPGQIGVLLLTKFLYAFELASFLLLVAAIGAVVLARRRRGLDAPDEPGPPTGISAGELARLPQLGSAAESAGGAPRDAGKGGW